MSFSMSPYPLRFGSRHGGGGFTPHFWVDSENGDDGNDGTSAEAAFQTLGAAETAALSRGNGTKIGLVRGSSWEEDLDLSTLTGAQVRAVGEGAMPQLDGSYLFEGTWDDSTDRADANTNVYSTSVTQTVAEGYITVWPSDGYLTWASSLANCQSTAGSFFIPDDATGSNKTGDGEHTVYIHPIGSTNPNSDGKTYRITDPTRTGRLVLGASGVVSGIETRRNMTADGSLSIGHGGLAIGCYCHEGVKHEALLSSGEYRWCYGEHPSIDARTDNIILEFYSSNGTGRSCVYRNSIAVGPGSEAAQVSAGMSGHNQGEGTYYDRIDAYDVLGVGLTTLLGGEVSQGTTVQRVRAIDCLTMVGIAQRSGTTAQIQDAWFYRTATTGTIRLFSIPCAVDGLRAYSGKISAIGFGADLALSQSVVKLINSAANSIMFDDQSAGVDLSYIGCIFDFGTPDNVHSVISQLLGGADVTLGTLQNNVYYTTSSSRMRYRIDGTEYFNPGTYLAAYPETGTQTVNPELTDPANGDFTPGANVTNGAGLLRPDVEFLSDPADPRAWIAANAPI